MLRLHHSVICAAALALAACTQAPLAPKANVAIESATSNLDWAQVGHRITGELRQRGMLVPPVPGIAPGASPWGPFYVHVLTPDSAFLQSVGDVLKSDIIATGGTVAETPEGASVINLKVDFVRHGMREQVPGGAGGVAGAITGLGIMGSTKAANAARSPWIAPGAAAGAAVLGGLIADEFLLNNPTMAGEAIWQASISSRQQVLMQVGGSMYISSTDIPLYTGDARLAAMTSPGTATRLETRRLRYSGGPAPAAPAPAPAVAPANPPCRC